MSLTLAIAGVAVVVILAGLFLLVRNARKRGEAAALKEHAETNLEEAAELRGAQRDAAVDPGERKRLRDKHTRR